LIGAVGLWLTVHGEGIAVSTWVLAPSLLVVGVGMGACFASIFDVALGNLAPSEGGSASGSLSAVQQLAAAVGSAVVTTVYFGQRATHGPAHALTVSVAVVAPSPRSAWDLCGSCRVPHRRKDFPASERGGAKVPPQSRSWWHTASSMKPKGSSQNVAK
jgi:hypothetical protein